MYIRKEYLKSIKVIRFYMSFITLKKNARENDKECTEY